MLKPQMHNTLLSLSTTFIADARVRLGLPESHLDPSPSGSPTAEGTRKT
jgi:hypothetical protein